MWILKGIIIYIVEWMGPIYIKIGQLAAHNTPCLRFLEPLSNNVKPMSHKNLLNIISQTKNVCINNKNRYEKDIVYIERDSFAAGCIAQVHKGIYNGETVAVKIKRQGIKNNIKLTFYFTKQLSRILDYIKILGDFGFYEKLTIVEHLFFSQVDFDLEIKNQIHTRNFQKTNPYIIIPRVIEDACSKDIIVMEYIKSAPIMSSYEHHNIITGFFFSSLIDGKIHGDLHPGNIGLVDNKLVIYDFGLIVDTSPKDIRLISQIMSSFQKRKIDIFVNTLLDIFVKTDNNKLQVQSKLVQSFEADGVGSQKHPAVHPIEILIKMFSLIREYNLSVRPGLVTFTGCFMSFGASLKILQEDGSSIEKVENQFIESIENSILH